jgi:catechol 2,3-dioxygenase-like lactoylglutathione lyase family enzyme
MMSLPPFPDRPRPWFAGLLRALLAAAPLLGPVASLGGADNRLPAVAVSGIAGVTYLTADAASMHRSYGHGAGFADAPQGPGRTRFAVGACQWVEFLSVDDTNWPRRLQYVTLEAPNLGDIERSLRARGILADWIGTDPRTRVLQFEDPAGNRIRVAEPWKAPAPRPGAPLPFSGHLQHFGFPVPRPVSESTLSFYRDTLGWPEADRMLGPDGRPSMVKFLLPGGRHEVVELVLFDKDLNKWAAGAIDHMNFEVADIDDAYRSLHRGGIATQAKQLPTVDAGRLWAINLFDPELTRVEIQVLAPATAPIGTVSAVGAGPRDRQPTA